MKNSLKILSMSVLLSTLCVAGCSCGKEEENVSRINDGEILSGLTKDASDYSLVDIYEAMLTSDAGNISAANALIDFVASDVLKMGTPQDTLGWKGKYDKIIEEKLQAQKDLEEFKVNGRFNESLFVQSLLSKGYNISKKANGEYDYTDYENKEFRVDALSTLLKQKYIMEETLKDSKNVVTTKKIRDVEYLTVSSSIEKTYSYYNVEEANGDITKVNIKARDFMNGIRDKIVQADEDEDFSNVKFDVYANELKELLKLAIATEVNKINKAEDYTQELAAKYTANYTRSVREGELEKLAEIDDLEFDYYRVLSSDSDKTSVVSETITNRLLNLSSPEKETKRAIKLGDWYYLVSSNAGAAVDARDILLTESSDGSTYTYSIVRFKVINADNYAANKEKVVELLASGSTLANGAVGHYIGRYKNQIKVNDDAVYEYLKKIYPDVFTD